jgi:hypothetical protein
VYDFGAAGAGALRLGSSDSLRGFHTGIICQNPKLTYLVLGKFVL